MFSTLLLIIENDYLMTGIYNNSIFFPNDLSSSMYEKIVLLKTNLCGMFQQMHPIVSV